MTLEQIKNRQDQINKSLYTLLEDTVIVVERIIGEQPKEGIMDRAEPSSGLLEEIGLSQNTTEHLINRLNEYRQLLAYKVFAPVEPECKVESACTAGYAQVRTY
jgi:mevalonate kinase